MRRDIEKELLEWKNEAKRYPLVIRGARQVGKSYTIKNFGLSKFENYIEIKF